MHNFIFLHDLIGSAGILVKPMRNYQAWLRSCKLIADHAWQRPCRCNQKIGNSGVELNQGHECCLVHIIGGDLFGAVKWLTQRRPERIDVLAACKCCSGDDSRFSRQTQINSGILHQNTTERSRLFRFRLHTPDRTAFRSPRLPNKIEAINQRRPVHRSLIAWPH